MSAPPTTSTDSYRAGTYGPSLGFFYVGLVQHLRIPSRRCNEGWTWRFLFERATLVNG